MRDIPRKLGQVLRLSAGLISRAGRRISRFIAKNLPVLLDIAALVALVVGVRILYGSGWAWIAAAAGLMLAGLRAQS